MEPWAPNPRRNRSGPSFNPERASNPNSETLNHSTVVETLIERHITLAEQIQTIFQSGPLVQRKAPLKETYLALFSFFSFPFFHFPFFGPP